MTKSVAHFQSPIGKLEIISENDFISGISFQTRNEPTETNTVLNQCISELEAYFSSNLKVFTVPFKLKGTEFQQSVWDKLTEIPFGKTITYTELAVRLGDVKCIRAAGTANGKNPIPIIVPCHRVIGKNGDLVGFSGGLENKKALLKHEGIIRGEQVEIFA